MKTATSVFAFVALFSASSWAITVETVPVGNAGNAPDSDTGRGSVAYKYHIGKFEVTNAQYVEFLNGVDPTGANTLALYSSSMTSNVNGGMNFDPSAGPGAKYSVKIDRGNQPVVFVSWYDAIRFANWLHNGQGAGDTESGAYTLLGGTPTPSNGSTVARNPGAGWVLASHDEWYKAAYHMNDGVTGNYLDYPTSSNVAPYSAVPPGTDAPDPSKTANFYWTDGIANTYDNGFAVTGQLLYVSSQNYLTDVGAYALSTNPYGTFDQGGNVFEWNEGSVFFISLDRVYRGGAWNFTETFMSASMREITDPRFEDQNIGFRVAFVVPEPSPLVLFVLGSLVLVGLRR